MIKRVLYLAATLLVFSQLIHADSIDDYVRDQMAFKHVPGAAIIVVKDGKVVKKKGYGLASVEFQVAANTDDVFEIGSVTKQYTASLIMMLVQDGKVDLDARISKYLADTPMEWERVTVRHLLTHTSGIPSYTRIGGFELFKRYTAADAIKELSKYPMDFEPGEKYRYNNSGYNLLGYIIEAVSGKSYWEFLGERILIPLSMRATNNRDPINVLPKRVNGYEWDGNKLNGRDGVLTDLLSAGAIVSTVEDMAKWEAALNDTRFLSTESKAEMWRKQKLNSGEEINYGLGWGVSNYRGQRIVSHGGQTAGFSASFTRFRDKGLAIIVLTNIGTSGIGNLLARGIAKFYIPSLRIQSIEIIPETDAARATRFRQALESVSANRDISNYALPAVSSSLKNWKMKDALARFKKAGKITKFELIESEDSNGGIYRVTLERGIFLFSFSENEDGRLTALSFVEYE